MAKSFGPCGIFSTDDAVADQRQIEAESFVEEDDFYDDLNDDSCADCSHSPCVCADREYCYICDSNSCRCADEEEKGPRCYYCDQGPCICDDTTQEEE